MKRVRYTARAASLAVLVSACLGAAAGRFDQKLPLERQAVHVLNRLTFGPRPGDLEQIRRLGVEKWIDQQLHPEQIAESPILETKLKPLVTLQLATWQIAEKYPPFQPFMIRPQAFTSLGPQQTARLMNGSVEERRNTLTSLDPSMRRAVLASVPPQVLEGLPDDIRDEAAEAQKAEQEERQKEMRRLMPPLNELLTPDQAAAVSSSRPDVGKR